MRALHLLILVFFSGLATTNAGSQTFSTLYSFQGAPDGANPLGGVYVSASGSIYGTTGNGGITGNPCYDNGCGILFKLEPSGKETVLYSFTGMQDGRFPASKLTPDGLGNLYGSTHKGGDPDCYFEGCGTVFRVAPGAQPSFVFQFDGLNGLYPANVTRGPHGLLYGATSAGGAADRGTVYSVTPLGGQTVLHSFGQGQDACEPLGTLAFDAAGNLYGTASQGGPSGHGAVFKITKDGVYSIVFDFPDFSDGGEPQSNVIVDEKGNLYATADSVIFELTAGQETVLFHFSGGAQGSVPVSIVRDKQGNIYGSLYHEGDPQCSCGTLYKLDTKGNFSILHTFTGKNGDGAFPTGDLALDAAGNLYGTTMWGGTFGHGVVYKIKP